MDPKYSSGEECSPRMQEALDAGGPEFKTHHHERKKGVGVKNSLNIR